MLFIGVRQRFQQSLLRSIVSAAIGIGVLTSAGMPAFGQTATFSVVYTFTGGSDGASPSGPIFLNKKGYLYGTTYYGGDITSTLCVFGALGCGTVFQVAPSGVESILYRFTGGADGYSTLSGVVQDAGGNLFGTTTVGGTNSEGTVFKIDSAGVYNLFFSFPGGSGGILPAAGAVLDTEGNLYGDTFDSYTTACNVVASGCGVVYKLDAAGTETVIGEFTSTYAGNQAGTSLLRDKQGNLYGTTTDGGFFEYGNVFVMAPSGKESVLHSFRNNGVDGYDPSSSLILDTEGNLYGVTQFGGAYNKGVVYKVDPAGNETILYTFTGGLDGAYPVGALVRGSEGSLYGTASSGGLGSGCCGLVFKIDAAGNETVVYQFAGGADGAAPRSGLVGTRTADGFFELYGSTPQGGDALCPNAGVGCGTVFKLRIPDPVPAGAGDLAGNGAQ